MMSRTRLLGAADMVALDELLAYEGVGGTFARGHLRMRPTDVHGLVAYGVYEGAALGAALVYADGICWIVWRDPSFQPDLAAVLRDRSGELLSGPADYVAPVLALLPTQIWRDQDRCPFEALTPDAFITPSTSPPSTPRLATFGDMEGLISFYIRGFYSLARLPSREAWRQRLKQQLDYRSTFILEESGVITAAAMSSAETPDKAMIGGVATLASHRNRGYSTAVVAGLCAHLFAGGKSEIGLFYMPGNSSAAKVYSKLGFRARGEWWLTRLAAL